MPVAPVVFVGHPTSLSSAFALWLPSAKSSCIKWREEWWMPFLSPLTFLYSVIWMWASPKVCTPYLWMDHFVYHKVPTAVWLSRVWGWRFLSNPRAAHYNIKEILRSADRAGVRVLGLGALNKAEFVNGSGLQLVAEVQPRLTCVVHGNTLTAAVVVEAVLAVLDEEQGAFEPCQDSKGSRGCSAQRKRRRRVFLTGPTSKVGRGVALELVRRGVEVVCATSSGQRFARLQLEALALLPAHGCALGRVEWADTLAHGVQMDVWVIGKYDLRVRDHIPFAATAVVFSVPCPLTPGEGGADSALTGSRFRSLSRSDVRVVEGGLLRLDDALCSSRRFGNLLPTSMVYACHAAAIVHYHKGWTHHEVGEVVLSDMPTVLDAARDLGMTLPPLPPPPPCSAGRGQKETQDSRDEGQRTHAIERVGCVVVGAGASGLAVAACLKERGFTDVVLLEARSCIEGHWGSQYDELAITSRKQHCELPHYTLDSGHMSIKAGEPGHDTMTAAEFVAYLRRFAARFRLDVRLGCRVESARYLPNLAASGAGGGHWVISYQTDLVSSYLPDPVTHAGADGCDGTECKQGAGVRRIMCAQLVDASGLHSRPYLPPLVCDRLGGFRGQVLHSSRVRSLPSLALKQVVVVGLGNSGADITMALLAHGARHVTVSIRSMPAIVRRQWGPLAVEWVSIGALQHLPSSVADACVSIFGALFYSPGWWRRFAPSGTPSWSPYTARRVPVIDKWASEGKGAGLVDKIKDGSIRLVGQISGASDFSLSFNQGGGGGGREVGGAESQFMAHCDVVILATGFRPTSHEWLSEYAPAGGEESPSGIESSLSVLESRQLGQLVHRVGFSHGDALLPLRQIAREARLVAARIAPPALTAAR